MASLRAAGGQARAEGRAEASGAPRQPAAQDVPLQVRRGRGARGLLSAAVEPLPR
jgi:hypothetical protein